ncbi:MAG: DHHA1 domain-containing protein [Thermoplasmatota archaeon]
MHALLHEAQTLVDRVRASRHVHIVSHIDADGITAAAVAARALERAGKSYDVEFLKSLRPEDVERIRNLNPETLWFTDLGSGAAALMERDRPVISDHHVPTARGPFHLNCHFFGEDGARALSGATTTYLVARALATSNRDMAGIALVGAVGDLQDVDAGRLTSLNRIVLDDAAAHGNARALVDARYFGRETRPLTKLLQFADDPCIPGVSGRESACVDFLVGCEVHLRHGEEWRTWVHLTPDERKRVLSAVAKSLLAKGYGAKAVRRLVGEVVVLPNEAAGTPTRDAKEFATLLNSTARYGEGPTGLAVAMGDRGEAYEKSLELLRGHRRNLVAGIQLVRERGITERDQLQYFHATDAIRETIVGIVAGMVFNAEGVRRDLPMFAFASSGDAHVKVSARANRTLVDRGLDLSAVMREAAAAVGGAGGGHAPAAGATIPKGTENAFLDAAEGVLRQQMSRARTSA